MAKWCGMIGFTQTQNSEDNFDIWEDSIIEKRYYGELIRNSRRLQNAGVLDDVTISNQISIISDPYANENFHSIRYAEFMGTEWRITDVEVSYPRLILTLGGVYNE